MLIELRLRRGALSVCLTAFFLGGCNWSSGPERVAVQGEVNVSGKPLRSGRISFLPTEETRGPTAVATVIDGKFALPSRTGPTVGKNKVQIEAIVDPGFELDDEAAYAKAVETKLAEGESEAVLPKQPIPSDYNEQTELSVDISNKGRNNLEIQVDVPFQPSDERSTL